MSKYSDLLRELVVERLRMRNWSQNELAKALNVAPSDLSDWLNGKVKIRYERFCQIAEVLDIQPWELLKPPEAESTQTHFARIGKLVVEIAVSDPVMVKHLSNELPKILKPHPNNDPEKTHH